MAAVMRRSSRMLQHGFYRLRDCSHNVKTSFSTAVETLNTINEPEEIAQNIKQSSPNVPFLFLPHTVKKAYVVNGDSTTLPKVFDKYKWLTKTVSTPGLPDFYKTDLKPDMNEYITAFHDSLQQTVAYQKSYRNDNLIRLSNERVTYNIAANFLQTAIIANNDSDHLNTENSSLYHEVLLETHWPRNYKFYQTKFRPTFCLRTKHGFDCIEDTAELSPDEIMSIPGPYDNYALNVYRHHIVHLYNRPGMDNHRFNPIKHCHSTVMVNTRIKTDEQFYALANFTSFAQLASQAQSQGVLHGMALEKPLVTHTILTNGHKIVFMVYQLNTMQLLDDKGVWNRCWYSPVLSLYDRAVDGPLFVFEDAAKGEHLEGFSEEACKYFLNFLGRQTIT